MGAAKVDQEILYMLQLFQRHITTVYFECLKCLCFIRVFWTYVTSVFIGILYMFTNMLHVFYLKCCVCFNGVQVFIGVFSSISTVFIICCNCCIYRWFRSRLGVASFLSDPPSVALCLGAGKASIWHCGWVHLNCRRHAPFLSCRSNATGPMWSPKCSAARGRLSTRSGANTIVLFFHVDAEDWRESFRPNDRTETTVRWFPPNPQRERKAIPAQATTHAAGSDEPGR